MHVDSDLSAYLDHELEAGDRARVEAHLDACRTCRARLAELQATASLIAALPPALPRRSLVPSMAPRFNWLRPLRSFSTFATGAFLFVFVLTAVGRSGSGLGGGGTGMPFGAAPAAVPAAASAGERERTAFATAQPLPAPGAADAARAFTASPPAALAAQPSPQATRQGSTEGTTAAATQRAEALGPAQTESATQVGRREPPPLTDPLLWLALTVIAAVIALAAHQRLRST